MPLIGTARGEGDGPDEPLRAEKQAMKYLPIGHSRFFSSNMRARHTEAARFI